MTRGCASLRGAPQKMRSRWQKPHEGNAWFPPITLCKATHVGRPSKTNPMKTVLSKSKVNATCVALLFSALLVSTSYAADPSASVCVGSTVVPITAMKPLLPNGRGPLIKVQTGSKTVCRMCPVTTSVASNTLPNGRGVQSSRVTTERGVEHSCASCAPTARL